MHRLIRMFAAHNCKELMPIQRLRQIALFGLASTCVDPEHSISWGPNNVFSHQYCKFGNFREGIIFAKLRLCEVS